MELYTIAYFTVVAEELNITKAAEQLNMSQPPLSKQMMMLEAELGTPLFIRGKRHLTLTEAGSLFYRRAVQILNLVEHAKEEISSLNGLSGTIHISTVEGRAPYLLSRWITGFREEFPNVKFVLWNGGGDEVLERLSRGLSDLGLVALPYDPERLAGFSVGREPWVAIIPRDHPLAKEPGDFIPLSALADEPLVVPSRQSRINAIHTWFEEIKTEPNIVCALSNYLDAIALVEQGAGIAIFPQTTYAKNEFLVTKVITGSERQVEYAIVWNKNQRNTALVDEFLHFIQDSLEEETCRQKYNLPENEYFPPKETKFL